MLGRGGLGGVELAGGRLVAEALAVTLGGVADLFGDATVFVVVVPEDAGDDHGSCLPILYVCGVGRLVR
jgi:hypothetical protein